jgi:uncharacterized protein (DUF2062 family)
MPRRYFRRISRAYRQNEDAWYIRPFRNLPGMHTAFAVTRHAVAGGVWFGLLIAFLPFPGHTVAVIVGSLALRLNLPVTLAAACVSNPLTIVPMFSLNYVVGAWLMGTPPISLNTDQDVWEMLNEVGQIWQPLWLGSVFLGLLASTASFAVISIAWRLSARSRLRRRTASRDGTLK